MAKLIINLLILTSILLPIDALYLRYSSEIIEHTMGPSTGKQIDWSFRNALERKYDLLILGNSKFYRGLNPDCFNISTYNFAHDNDGYNQMYYRLKYLLANHVKPSYLILSVDYAPFSNISNTRNKYFKNYFGRDYFNDYKGISSESHQRFGSSEVFNDYMALRFGMTFPRFLESCFKILSGTVPDDPPRLKENGQYLKAGRPTPELFVNRNFGSLDLQEHYFHSIVDLCKTNHIKVFLVMPPFLDEDLSQYPKGQVAYFSDYFRKLVDNKNVYYFDFSRDRSFTVQDFTGIAHLNEQAANDTRIVTK